jgi:hypothetical protein
MILAGRLSGSSGGSCSASSSKVSGTHLVRQIADQGANQIARLLELLLQRR